MRDDVFKNLIKFGVLRVVDTYSYELPFFINADSEVFIGHFPKQPIMPGVVMVEIIKRATEIAVDNKVDMVSASNFKFLKMVEPNEHKEAVLHFTIKNKDDTWRVKAQLKINNAIYFKSDAIYKSRS